MSVDDRIVNLEEGIRDTYAALRLHIDEGAVPVLDALERDHIFLLQKAAFMEGKLREQTEEALR